MGKKTNVLNVFGIQHRLLP